MFNDAVIFNEKEETYTKIGETYKAPTFCNWPSSSGIMPDSMLYDISLQMSKIQFENYDMVKTIQNDGVIKWAT